MELSKTSKAQLEIIARQFEEDKDLTGFVYMTKNGTEITIGKVDDEAADDLQEEDEVGK